MKVSERLVVPAIKNGKECKIHPIPIIAHQKKPCKNNKMQPQKPNPETLIIIKTNNPNAVTLNI